TPPVSKQAKSAYAPKHEGRWFRNNFRIQRWVRKAGDLAQQPARVSGRGQPDAKEMLACRLGGQHRRSHVDVFNAGLVVYEVAEKRASPKEVRRYCAAARKRE